MDDELACAHCASRERHRLLAGAPPLCDECLLEWLSGQWLDARAALGPAWLAGGASLAEGIARKTKRLEELASPPDRHVLRITIQAVQDLMRRTYGVDIERRALTWLSELERIAEEANTRGGER